MRKGLISSVNALPANTGWTLKPSPTQCFGVAGKISLTVRRSLLDDAAMVALLLNEETDTMKINVERRMCLLLMLEALIMKIVSGERSVDVGGGRRSDECEM